MSLSPNRLVGSSSVDVDVESVGVRDRARDNDEVTDPPYKQTRGPLTIAIWYGWPWMALGAKHTSLIIAVPSVGV